jgi:hypothetical protein
MTNCASPKANFCNNQNFRGDNSESDNPKLDLDNQDLKLVKARMLSTKGSLVLELGSLVSAKGSPALEQAKLVLVQASLDLIKDSLDSAQGDLVLVRDSLVLALGRLLLARDNLVSANPAWDQEMTLFLAPIQTRIQTRMTFCRELESRQWKRD